MTPLVQRKIIPRNGISSIANNMVCHFLYFEHFLLSRSPKPVNTGFSFYWEAVTLLNRRRRKSKAKPSQKREKLWWWLWERALLCNKFSIGQKRLLFIFLSSFIFFDSHEQTSIVMPTLAVQMGTRKCVRLRGWTKQRLKQYNAHKNTFQEKSTTSLFTLPTT